MRPRQLLHRPKRRRPRQRLALEASAVAKPAKKPVAKHETDKHKARRIAAKYGVYWYCHDRGLASIGKIFMKRISTPA
jgi:hypothetical protein